MGYHDVERGVLLSCGCYLLFTKINKAGYGFKINKRD